MWAPRCAGRLSLAALLLAAAPAYADEPDEPEPEPTEPEAPTTGTITGTVEAPDLEAPLAGATVIVVGTNKLATTDDEGRYELVEVAPGTVKLRVESAGFKPEERALTVAAGVTVKADFKLATAPLFAETIVVVGSRTPRTNAESPVAVDIVSAEELARSGRTETGRILHTLAASYISTPQTVADGSDHVDPASLRGLGPDQVLILVNGKRRHRSALLHLNGTFGRGTVGTDLNAIAVGSIKRIEILRDGASTQYGSDAIAGVINIVTKDATDVLDVATTSGITASGDGAQLKTSANYGFKVGDGGFLNLTGEFLQRDATSRSGRYDGTVFTDDRAADDRMLASLGLTRDDFAMKIGESAATSGIGAFNLELPIDKATKFYSFGDLSHRRGSAAGFYRFPKQTAQTVPEFFPIGFLPEIHPTIDDVALTVGVRRKGTWTVDASLTRGQSSFKFNIERSVNASLGTSSPTTFDAGTLKFEQTVANIDLLRKLDVEGVKSVSLVLGSELRVENYQILRGDEASFANGGQTFGDPPQPKIPGAQVFPGFQPSNEVDRTRDNAGVYAGLETELSKKVAVDVGGRAELYSDFGRSLIGKIAARARLGGPLSMRGAVSTGFRAPSLHQLWFSNISTLFLPDATGVLQPAQVLTSNNQSPITRAFGIPSLTEEKSLNASGGFVVRSGEHLAITADAYYIQLRDRIVLTSQFTDGNPIVAQILAPFTGVSQAQFFANAVDTDTMGLDVVVDYQTRAGDGTLTLTGAANFTTTEVVRVNLPDSLVAKFSADPAQLRTFFFGRLAKNRLEDAVPHQKGTAAVRYNLKGFTGMVRANYYGRVRFKPDDSANDETFGAKVLFDVDLGYQLSKNLYLGVGADNVFDTFPDPQTKAANLSNGRFLYSRNVSQFGMNGGFYYGKLQLTFF
ncbi:MAG: TonB-dependent receptor [Deltaproteobacteria bacterium]|nr:TonB-dependent receptor [Deltaproteobacteria bacterium]